MRKITLSQMVDEFMRPGTRILLHAGPSESRTLIDTLAADPERAAGVTFVGAFVPGLNRFDYAGLTATSRLETVFVSPAHRASFEAGRLDLLPIHYSSLPDALRRQPADVAILRLPPARDGVFSCGPTADVAEGVARFARRVVVMVDPSLPWTHGGVAIEAAAVEAIVDLEPQAVAPDEPAGDDRPDPLADAVAALIDDGATLQIGIGRLPGAVLRRLGDRRGLRFRSGMIVDAVVRLAEAGALAREPRDGEAPVLAGIAVGGAALQDFCRRPDVALHGIDVTHDVRRIAEVETFVAINAAIEVDLLGQVNCEAIDGRTVSGIGGSADFARGARLSPGGRSIVALASRSGERARIVPTLAGPTGLGRADIDTLVTDQGAVRLRDLALDARAEAIVSLADPRDRPGLLDAWRDLRARM